jgi:type IV pilus assembly protein PilP
MRAVYGLLAMAGLIGLAGCGASREDDIRQWMVEERNQMRPKVPPISAPKQF